MRVRLNRRKAFPWKPTWEPEISGWAFNHIQKNMWRLESINDIEDWMQDAYLVFLKVQETYPRVVEAPHFMALYKTSLRNYLHDKSREYTRKQGIIDEGFDPEDTSEVGDKPDLTLGVSHNDGPLMALIANATPELKLLLHFIQDDVNLAELCKPQRARRGEPRLTLDAKLSQLLGISHFPFRNALKRLLST